MLLLLYLLLDQLSEVRPPCVDSLCGVVAAVVIANGNEGVVGDGAAVATAASVAGAVTVAVKCRSSGMRSLLILLLVRCTCW